MEYAILIYESEEDRRIRREGGARQEAVGAAYKAYTRALREAGVMRDGQQLALPEMATTLVSRREDTPLIHDGPYADLKEQLGGFYLIEVADLDEAIMWAARCPVASTGKVEVRPLRSDE